MVIILKQHEDVQPNNSERMALPIFLVVGHMRILQALQSPQIMVLVAWQVFSLDPIRDRA